MRVYKRLQTEDAGSNRHPSSAEGIASHVGFLHAHEVNPIALFQQPIKDTFY
jgi:hypothetical protein